MLGSISLARISFRLLISREWNCHMASGAWLAMSCQHLLSGVASFGASALVFGATVLALGAGESELEAESADLVIFNARVITIDNERPEADSLAIRDGRFLAVGTQPEISKLIGARTEVWDAEGKVVVPGFNDAHLHPSPLFPPDSIHAMVDCSPKAVLSIDELVEALRQKAGKTPSGVWVRGDRYQDTKLGRHPTREDLDRASTDHPIVITHSSGHIKVFNSVAMKLARIDRETVDPNGGAFDRDEAGVPNGICRESAASLVMGRGPEMPPVPEREKIEGLVARCREYASHGLTSIQHAGTSLSQAELYIQARYFGQPLRVYVMLRPDELAAAERLRVRGELGDEFLKLGGIKMFHGNSLSGRTCWLYEPYADRPDYYGIPPKWTQEELDDAFFRVHKAGLQVCIHSNGDREIDMVLTACERALDRLPKQDHRHRIEHCSIVNESILQRIKKLGMVVAPHSYVYEHGDKMEAYGEKRWDWMHPNRSAIDLGIPVAGTSDSPVSEARPLLRIQSMVTRKSAEGKVYGPKQKVTVEQALRIWTLESAYASFDEQSKGSITPGKLADFVVLDNDPRKVNPEEIGAINVLRTYVGGSLVYAREAAE